MKNKIIIILVLIILFAPLVSRADYRANLTIIVNTQESDSSFHFEVDRRVVPVLVKAQPKNLFAFVWQNIKYYSGQLIDFLSPRFALADMWGWLPYKQFNIQTENFSGATTSEIDAPDMQYELSQTLISGFKINSIFCTSNNPSDAFFYQEDNVIFTPVENENITCIFNNVKEKIPVLIVPGLLGTEMKKGEELLWSDLLRMFGDVGDSFMDSLSFNASLAPSDSGVSIFDVVGVKVFGPIKYDYIDGLINEFKSQGYAENENLFTFPYDWRYGVSGKFEDGTTNADLLAQKIQDILQQTGSEKVDVVAHSLGGLIVKKYVIEHPADNHIGKAVFVGVPNTGAPKAVKVLLQGDSFNIPWLSQSEIKKISENMPASYDLLPSQKYYDVKSSFVEVIDRTDVLNPKIFFLTYEQTKNFLTDDHNLNSDGLAGALNLHTQNFDDFDLRTAGVDVYSINGCKAGTIGQVIEVRSKDIFGGNYTTYARPKETPGDGTVPLESATNLPIDQSNKYYALKSDHGKMPSQNGIRQEIVNLISGSNLLVSSDSITQDISKCNLNGKAISVFSPINIFVTDQGGNKLGLASDNSIINEITNADFEIMGEHKFIYLPTDDGQVYNININGTGNGTFTIKSEDIGNSQVTGAEIFSNLPVTPELTGLISLSSSAGSGTTLIVRQNSMAEPETILPSAVIDAAQSEDLLPPVSAPTLTGTAGQPGFYRSNVVAKIESTDDLSGVLDIEYNLDGAGYQKIPGETAVVNISSEGKHTLKFFSADKAGNNEQEQTIIFTIDKTPPEAIIEFDQNAKDLKFSGTDNISGSSSISVKDKDDTITLTDQAGNTTEIKLKERHRRILMRAGIKSIKYNGVSADISKNLMAYLWISTKRLTMLSQHVQSKKGYNILAVFDGKNTKITGKDSSGKILKSFSGLKIIKIITKNGDFSWFY